MATALVRKPTPSIVRAISQHPEKHTINYERARDQHHQYVAVLESSGAKVIHLPQLNDYPDAVFIEDTAVTVEDKAYLCSMGAKSRHSEGLSVLRVLEKLLPVETIDSPIMLDGGDVLQTEEILFMGLSTRTNQQAIDFFRSRVSKTVISVPVSNCLHLKTAATYIGQDTLIVDPQRIDLSIFSNFKKIEITPEESYSTNVLAIGDSIIMAEGYPRLSGILASRGFKVLTTPMSEFEKADGGITCLSLILPNQITSTFS
tara:strand:+ start:1340 stop:2116 length:777 start_codon:yes stop_codon:yes gene_type:complete